MSNTDTFRRRKKGSKKPIPETKIHLWQSQFVQNILKRVKKLALKFQKLFSPLKKNIFLSIKDLVLGLSLKTKWMLFTFVFIVSFSAILVSFFIKNGNNNLKLELEKWATSLASNLANGAQYAALVKDNVALQNYLEGIMNQEEIIYSCILDDNGAILAKVDPAWMFTLKIQHLSAQTIDISEFQTIDGVVYYNIVKPITINIEDNLTDEQVLFDKMDVLISKFNDLKFRSHTPLDIKGLGTVVLGISTENLEEKLSIMRNRAISITFVIALICIAVVFWGVNKITSPIKQLVEAVRKVTQDDLSHSIENHRRDELGLLADSFNEMIVKLKKSRNKIKSYTQTLEDKISDRTRELRESEKKYRTLFEHSGTAVTVIEEDERLSMVNIEFETLSGYSRAETEGKMTFLNFLTSENRKKIKQYLEKNKNIDELGEPINYECTFIDRFGKHKNINLNMSMIPDTKKLLVSIADVTELKELQKKLIRSEKLAAIGKLSAAIAHEIRNPLGAISTSVDILKKGLNLNGQDQELMEIICEESIRLNRIITDFIQFARPKEPKFRPVDINGLIQEILLLFRDKMGNGIEKSVELTENLPLVLADPDQLKQVMINIIINVIDAMPDGGLLTVTTSHVQNRFGNYQIGIVFKDTGCGISKPNLEKIFLPFYSTKENGSGMGLPICERIIQNHGGELKVESKSSEGTQFTIILPMKV